ncbi:RidA family protein [Gulosibacter molinativorax]|uniref:RidA family protein n=1 Tax=Gulosibacter molinativorax TaxID=256821 RepID=A0ABT7C5K2_9MICO|nr:RidA family protein [Gulosibacter molinativorax]MDJ1370478.1 RidA family protein [Gulosibacter molinativorax]QUY62112.1 Enamine/imine deaminase [Gulosibacter molinativorax]
MASIRTYSHGVPQEEAAGLSAGYSVNGTIYVSGQMSHDMQGNFVGEGDIEAQTRQTLENIDRVLAGFGVAKSNIAEVQVFLTDVQRDHALFNAIFKEYLGEHRPAATLLGIASLPGGPSQLIEIRVVAYED